MSASLFFCYRYLLLAWTCTYNGRPAVIGRQYTKHAMSYVDRHPGISRDMLIMDAAGKIEAVWTQESIDRCGLVLASMYVLIMPVLAICLTSVIQALSIVEGDRRRRPRRGSSDSSSSPYNRSLAADRLRSALTNASPHTYQIFEYSCEVRSPAIS
jgi:hypothetical protein